MEIDSKEKNCREERRRKIVGRGSDRIALITSRTHNLPSPQPPHSSPVSDEDHRDIDPITGYSEGEGVAGLPRNENVITSSGRYGDIHEEDNARAIVLDKSLCKLAKSSRPHPKSRSQPTFFCSKRLNQCILSGLTIAAMVIFNNAGLKSGGFISSRPLHLLLLTDATIVGVRMKLDMQRSLSESTEEEGDTKASQEDSQNWDRPVKLLERGLVAYQRVRGVFIDYSVLMVIVNNSLSQVPFVP